MLYLFSAAASVFVLLLWNDSNISRTRKRILPMLNDIVQAPCTPSDAYDDMVVHITCDLDTNGVIYAPKEFSSNIYSHNGVFLETRVEMFQWASVTGFFGIYRVGKFVDHVVDNGMLGISLFHNYKNPTFFPHVSGTGRKFSHKLRVGGYNIPKGAFVATSRTRQLDLIDDRWYQPSSLTYPLPIPEVNHLNTRVHENALYTGDPLSPKIGDLRITFWGSEATRFSVIGRQKSSIIPKEYSLEPVQILNHRVVLLSEGKESPYALAQQFLSQYEASSSVCWGLRFTAFLLIATSIYMYYRNVKAPKSDITLLICGTCASAMIICTSEAIIWITYKTYISLLLAAFGIVFCCLVVSAWRINPLCRGYKGSDGNYIGLHGPYDSVRWSTASPTASIAISSDQPLLSARNI